MSKLNTENKKNIFPKIICENHIKEKKIDCKYENIIKQKTYINYFLHRNKPIQLEIFNSIQKEENHMFYTSLLKREKFHKKNETISYNNDYTYKRYDSSKKIRNNSKEILHNIQKIDKKYKDMNKIKSKDLNDYSVLHKFYNKLVFNKI